MNTLEKKEQKDESKQEEKKEVKKKIGRPPLVKSNTAKFKKEMKNVIIDFFKVYSIFFLYLL
jgi:hypothetical protein